MSKFKATRNIISKKFDEHDWACFHDAVMDATGKSHGQKKLQQLFDELPEDIKFTAFQWGMNDTVFGDEVVVHFRPKEKVVKEEVPTGGRQPLIIAESGLRGVGKSFKTEQLLNDPKYKNACIWNGVRFIRLHPLNKNQNNGKQN